MINSITKLGWQLLEDPIIYRGFQFLFGSEKFCKHYASVIDANQGDRILDIGCGTGDIQHSLPHVQYVGFNSNEKYINTAKRRFEGRGEFVCASLGEDNLSGGTSFDIGLATGVLHHLNDDACSALFRLAYKSLRPRNWWMPLEGFSLPIRIY